MSRLKRLWSEHAEDLLNCMGLPEHYSNDILLDILNRSPVTLKTKDGIIKKFKMLGGAEADNPGIEQHVEHLFQREMGDEFCNKMWAAINARYASATPPNIPSSPISEQTPFSTSNYSQRNSEHLPLSRALTTPNTTTAHSSYQNPVRFASSSRQPTVSSSYKSQSSRPGGGISSSRPSGGISSSRPSSGISSSRPTSTSQSSRGYSTPNMEPGSRNSRHPLSLEGFSVPNNRSEALRNPSQSSSSRRDSELELRQSYGHMSPRSSRELAEVKGVDFGEDIQECIDEFMDICHEDQISLRSDLVHSYVTLDDSKEQLVPSGASPMLFKISKKSFQQSKQLHYGDVICLSSLDQSLVVSDGSSVYIVKRRSKPTEWKILSTKKLTGTVKVTHNIVLQCGESGHLAANRDGEICLTRSRSDIAASWNISKGNLPYIPPWMEARLHMLREPAVSSNFSDEFRSIPRSHQEKIILENILFALMAIDGEYFSILFEGKEPPLVEMRRDKAKIIDDATYRLISKILPLCSAYAHIDTFVETRSGYPYGLVSHALCAAIRALMKEYLLLVTQLELLHRNGQLTLQKLWYYIQTSMRTLRSIQKLCRMVEGKQKHGSKVVGGALLNIIHDAVSREGDRTTRELYTHLISRASVPYFKILSHWVYRGEIKDAYGEFMIKQESNLNKENIVHDVNDKYWDQRYTVNKEMRLEFLDRVSDEILRAGKYLNVIRESGRNIEHPHNQMLVYSRDFTEIYYKIQSAGLFASKKLLDLLINEEKLIARLRSMKRYFFLDKGDFFVHFVDSAHLELSKRVPQIKHSKLQSLLDMAIQTSTAANDPYKDDIFFKFFNKTVVAQLQKVHKSQSMIEARNQDLTGFETFCLDVNVKWPLSLIISRHSREKYHLLFRHLFTLKHVERELCTSWLDHQSMKEMKGLGSIAHHSYRLRQQMLHFVQNLLFHMSIEVIEPNWHEFEAQVTSAETVDKLIEFHDKFLSRSLKACLLTNPSIIQELSHLLNACTQFSNQMNQLATNWRLQSAGSFGIKTRSRDRLTGRRRTIDGRSESLRELFFKTKHTLKDLENRFKQRLNNILRYQHDKNVGDQYFSNLCSRLDYNGFYSRVS